MFNRTILFLILLGGIAPSSSAQDMVYTPTNPSFGGNPFNSQHLLAIAETDRPERPSDSFSSLIGEDDSQADFFVRQLESRILARLSSDITDAIFGADAEPSGQFVFEDTTIDFETLLNGSVIITILDNVNGGQTVIEVPGFLAQASQ